MRKIYSLLALLLPVLGVATAQQMGGTYNPSMNRPTPTATPDPAKSEDVLRILGDLQSTYPELTAIEVVRTSNVDLCKMYENMYAKQDPKLSFFACKEKASHVILKR